MINISSSRKHSLSFFLLLSLPLLLTNLINTYYILRSGDAFYQVAINLVFFCFLFLSPILLIKKVRSFFLVWLVLSLLAPIYAYLIIFYQGMPGDALIGAAIKTDIRTILAIAQHAFIWLVIWSLYVVIYIWRVFKVPHFLAFPHNLRLKVITSILLFVLTGILLGQFHSTYRFSFFNAEIANEVFPSNLLIGIWRNQIYQQRETGFIDPILEKSNQGQAQIVVMIIGESVRSDHLSLNGYQRATTPYLNQIQHKLINFKKVKSLADCTHLAVPLLMTKRTNDGVLSLVDVFSKSGYLTAWLSNQEPSIFSSHADIIDFNPTWSWRNTVRQDTELIPQFRKIINQNLGKRFIVLHMLGSHYPYEDRYRNDQAKFLPASDRAFFAKISKEDKLKLINSYDNTIVAMDSFISQIIQLLNQQQQPAVLLFTSDHGENLYDNDKNLFMHCSAEPTEEELRVPMFFWFNDKYLSENNEKIAKMKANIEMEVDHSTAFPTILNLSGIHYRGYEFIKDLSASDNFHSVINKDNFN